MSRRILVQIPRTGEVFEVTGRAATFVVLICTRAASINALRVGKLVLNFVDSKTHPKLLDSWNPLRDDDDEVA